MENVLKIHALLAALAVALVSVVAVALAVASLNEEPAQNIKSV